MDRFQITAAHMMKTANPLLGVLRVLCGRKRRKIAGKNAHHEEHKEHEAHNFQLFRSYNSPPFGLAPYTETTPDETLVSFVFSAAEEKS